MSIILAQWRIVYSELMHAQLGFRRNKRLNGVFYCPLVHRLPIGRHFVLEVISSYNTYEYTNLSIALSATIIVLSIVLIKLS